MLCKPNSLILFLVSIKIKDTLNSLENRLRCGILQIKVNKTA